MSYNGWTNYETWNLALWIGNEPGPEEFWRETAREAFEETDEDDTPGRRIEDVACRVADMLERETKDNAPAVEGFYGDVMTAALGEVNWYEIAKNWCEEAAESAAV